MRLASMIELYQAKKQLAMWMRLSVERMGLTVDFADELALRFTPALLRDGKFAMNFSFLGNGDFARTSLDRLQRFALKTKSSEASNL